MMKKMESVIITTTTMCNLQASNNEFDNNGDNGKQNLPATNRFNLLMMATIIKMKVMMSKQ